MGFDTSLLRSRDGRGREEEEVFVDVVVVVVEDVCCGCMGGSDCVSVALLLRFRGCDRGSISSDVRSLRRGVTGLVVDQDAVGVYCPYETLDAADVDDGSGLGV